MQEPTEVADEVEKQAVTKGLSVKNAFLFLVDWRKFMLTRQLSVSDDGKVKKSMLSVVLQGISEIMKKQIIASSADLYGVVAFGTSGAVENAEWPRVRVIQPIERLSAMGIKRLQKISKRADELGKLEEGGELDAALSKLQNDKFCCFGDATPVQFDKALWASRLQLEPHSSRSSTERMLHRLRVIVLTYDEDPTTGKQIAHEQAKTQAKDIIDSMRAPIDVMVLSNVDDGGDVTGETNAMEDEDCKNFFDELIHGECSEIDTNKQYRGKVLRNVLSQEEIIDQFQYRNRTKRAYIRTTFTLHSGYTFGVACYILSSKKKRPTAVNLFAETNEPVKRVTTNTCMEIGKTLKPDEIRYTFNLACLRPIKARGRGAHLAESEGKQVPLFGFTKEEIVEMTAIGPRGITLYGFKPMKCLQREFVLKSPIFLHPDEQSYKGSQAIFTQLLYSMLKKNVFAIVLTALRKSSQPRFAVMIPQDEQLDDQGRQLFAPGFYLLALPFKDDMRHAWRDDLENVEEMVDTSMQQKIENLKEEELLTSNVNFDPKGTATAKKLIRGLTIKKYHPRIFYNPDLAKFYSALQKEAGVEENDEVEIEESEMHPKIEQIDRRQGTTLRKFKAETMGEDFDGKGMAESAGTKTGKRARETAEKAKAKKEAKIEAQKQALDNLNMDLYLSSYHGGNLNALRKEELVDYMKAHGIGSSGLRKPDCVMLVEQHIMEHVKNTVGSGGHDADLGHYVNLYFREKLQMVKRKQLEEFLDSQKVAYDKSVKKPKLLALVRECIERHLESQDKK